LYMWQNSHLFHEQFLVTRSKRLCASLGGRMGPCSISGINTLTVRNVQIVTQHENFHRVRRLAAALTVQTFSGINTDNGKPERGLSIGIEIGY